ncbi:hypothetical protein GCM10011529_29940 [Polymorphobacter glacialis]|uniref:Uncharacterized protein n=1 Tax=Sandarakinorhabdus glacialis TaxID=1614636 RepID=A0A917A0T9_9SPHN|nr:hypothetical protein [Polymorphobacter glacialis]GGE21335.1 hypothetical protein GCM10011529_29940 [Polymorphobacter glacialis]
MTETNRQRRQRLQHQAGDREKYFKAYQFVVFEVDHLTGLLSEAVARDVACDENGLASALRYIAEEKDGRVWRHSLRVIANALDNNKSKIRLRLVRSKQGPASTRAGQEARRVLKASCARFIFDRVDIGHPPKAAMADAVIKFGVSKKTIFLWLKDVAADHQRFRQTSVAMFDLPEEQAANDVFRTDPFSLWLESYDRRQKDAH